MISNCTWGAFGGQWTAGDLICRPCQQPMSLFPISKNQPPMFWDCTKSCKRKLFCTEIIDAFQEAQIRVQQDKEVSIMAFPIDDKEIRIEINSIMQIGTSRNKSTTKVLTESQKNELGDLLLDCVCHILSIDVEDLSDLFQT